MAPSSTRGGAHRRTAASSPTKRTTLRASFSFATIPPMRRRRACVASGALDGAFAGEIRLVRVERLPRGKVERFESGDASLKALRRDAPTARRHPTEAFAPRTQPTPATSAPTARSHPAPRTSAPRVGVASMVMLGWRANHVALVRRHANFVAQVRGELARVEMTQIFRHHGHEAVVELGRELLL